MTSDESMDMCWGLESQLTYDPAFLGWDFGCLFSTSCSPVFSAPGLSQDHPINAAALYLGYN